MSPNSGNPSDKPNHSPTETLAQKIQKRLARRAAAKSSLVAAKALPKQSNIFRISEVRESDQLAQSFGGMAVDGSNEKEAADLKMGLEGLLLKRRASELDAEGDGAGEEKRRKLSD